VKAAVKAGALSPNHSRKALAVKAAVKAGALSPNHNRKALAVKAGIKAGEGIFLKNHSRSLSR
jgi:hypothetical protein